MLYISVHFTLMVLKYWTEVHQSRIGLVSDCCKMQSPTEFMAFKFLTASAKIRNIYNAELYYKVL